MRRVWVHEELALARRTRTAPLASPGQQPESSVNTPLIISVAALIVLLTGLPLIITRSRQLPQPAIVRASLPELRLGDMRYTNRSKYRVSVRPPRVQTAVAAVGRPLNIRSAQIGYVAGLIRKTGVPELPALQLASLIVNESAAANFDPFLATAIIFAESTFRNHARSSAGAVGLMQIQPATGRYVSRMYRVRWLGTAALHDPRYNLRLGLAYMQYLKELFNGNLTRALVAYNWGPGNLSEHLYKAGRRPPLESVAYSQKIQRLSSSWRQQFAQQQDVPVNSAQG